MFKLSGLLHEKYLTQRPNLSNLVEVNFNSSIVDNDRSCFLESAPLGAEGIQDIPELIPLPSSPPP